MKEENQSFLLFFLFLEKERKRMGGGRNGAGALLLRPSLLFVNREELPLGRNGGSDRFHIAELKGKTFVVTILYGWGGNRRTPGEIFRSIEHTGNWRTLHDEVNSGSYSIFNLEKNHCFLNPEILSPKPVFPVSHRGFVRSFSGEPERVRRRVRCRWKDLAARNLYLMTLSCLEFQITRTECQPASFRTYFQPYGKGEGAICGLL
ncbi:hypothetical protein YC2023_011017 [Brassica napus]